MENKKEIDETFIKMVQEKSCSKQTIPVAGELYVSKDKSKEETINTFKTVFMGISAALILGIGLKIVGDMDAANDIRKEISKKEKSSNIIGGKFETKPVYDENFVNFTTTLTDRELLALYSYISRNMDENKNVIPEVVDNMEDDYLEKNKN